MCQGEVYDDPLELGGYHKGQKVEVRDAGGDVFCLLCAPRFAGFLGCLKPHLGNEK